MQLCGRPDMRREALQHHWKSGIPFAKGEISWYRHHGFLLYLARFLPASTAGTECRPLIQTLEEIIRLKAKYNVTLNLRALTRAESYNAAMASRNVLDLVKEAGFRKFGFGADGAVAILRAMRRGTSTLKSDLIAAFEHAENHRLIPEMLYVFGIPEDTEETLRATRDFLVGLLDEFPNSQYRGFLPRMKYRNQNWGRDSWKSSRSYELCFLTRVCS